MEKEKNLQESFLNQARKEKAPVLVYLTNGFQQRGVITAYDGYTLMLFFEGRQYLIYKHAVSTIVPQNKPLQLNE